MNHLAKDSEKGNELLRAYIAKNMSLLGIKNQRELAKRLHTSDKTVSCKLKDPGKWKLEELRKLFYVLHFSEQEKMDVWGGGAA